MYHGGKEHYRYPSLNLQKRCRKLVEKGADLVVCQHSHCVGSYEEIDSPTIIYAQGNFIFNTCNNEYWNTSLLVKMTITDGYFNIDFVPIVRTATGTRLANKTKSEEILTKFYERSEKI